MRPSDYAYNLGLLAALAGALPMLAGRMVIKGKYRRTMKRRLGFELPGPRTDGERPVWFHALSLGEVITAATIIEALAARRPDLPVTLSVATENGLDEAQRRFSNRPNVRLLVAPVDFPWAIERLVERLDPRLFALVETDVWPNLLGKLRRRGVPTVLVNGRLSPGSCRVWRRLGRFAARVWGGFDLCLMQSDVDAARAASLGVDRSRIMAPGNVKYDRTFPQEVDAAALREKLGLADGTRILVAGSTHRGEERAVLEAAAALLQEWPETRLILAPRQPERFDEAAGLVDRSGLGLWQRSQGPMTGPARVLLLDTLGELAAVYALAEAAFVGGSLIRERGVGGHNLLEPAAFGVPVLFGANMKNFPQMRDEFLAAGAGIEVADNEALTHTLTRLWAEPDQTRIVGRAAARLVDRHRGATRVTVDRLAELLLD
ncbi:MAG: 3-deoxy-D-manno-octulosonic acid transferase [Proteobacteria bacterium]|nr:3-deoxy-D-manno-octulosonic acid transferase [Pseudomonadota bacterium]